MDAIKFITEYKRMCASYTHCRDCPLFKDRILCSEIPSNYPEEFSTELTKVVKDWSAAHPITTRADLFKKVLPNTPTDSSGSLLICPAALEKDYHCDFDVDCKNV